MTSSASCGVELHSTPNVCESQPELLSTPGVIDLKPTITAAGSVAEYRGGR